MAGSLLFLGNLDLGTDTLQYYKVLRIEANVIMEVNRVIRPFDFSFEYVHLILDTINDTIISKFCFLFIRKIPLFIHTKFQKVSLITNPLVERPGSIHCQ